jgi:hypothetical protein
LIKHRIKGEHSEVAQAERWEEESDIVKEQCNKTRSGVPGSGGLGIGNIQIHSTRFVGEKIRTYSNVV